MYIYIDKKGLLGGKKVWWKQLFLGVLGCVLVILERIQFVQASEIPFKATPYYRPPVSLTRLYHPIREILAEDSVEHIYPLADDSRQNKLSPPTQSRKSGTGRRSSSRDGQVERRQYGVGGQGSPLKFIFNLSTVSQPSELDMQALQQAGDTLQDLLQVTVPPHPYRATLTAPVSVFCAPDYSAGKVQVDVSSIKAGEHLVFVYTTDMWCNDADTGASSVLAYTSMCGFENVVDDIGEQIILPLVSMINVCTRSKAAVSHEESGSLFRYKVFLHELIHSLGFGEEIIFSRILISLDIQSLWDVMVVDSAPVVRYARMHYNCSEIKGVPVIRGHWDPFFVGQNEIMTHCVSIQSMITPYTLALLGSLGVYSVQLGKVSSGIYQHILGGMRYALNSGCSLMINSCGSDLATTHQYADPQQPGNGLTSEACAMMCMRQGEPVVFPAVVAETTLPGGQVVYQWSESPEKKALMVGDTSLTYDSESMFLLLQNAITESGDSGLTTFSDIDNEVDNMKEIIDAYHKKANSARLLTPFRAGPALYSLCLIIFLNLIS